MRNLKDSSSGHAAIEIIVYSILPILVFSSVPAGFQAIQKQLAAESVTRMVARELMISKANSPEAEAARLTAEIASEFDYPADVTIQCFAECSENAGWYRLSVNIGDAVASKVAVIEKR